MRNMLIGVDLLPVLPQPRELHHRLVQLGRRGGLLALHEGGGSYKLRQY
jgi:hypothetical protein